MCVKFKVGDKVKVVNRVGDDVYWSTAMYASIGQILTIIETTMLPKSNIAGKEFYRLSNHYYYPPTSLDKISFSSLDEAVLYMKRGGYIVAELFPNDFVCYRIRKNTLEVNNIELGHKWSTSLYDIEDFSQGHITPVNKLTKWKYYENT